MGAMLPCGRAKSQSSTIALGLLFMAVVIFLPGGLVQGGEKIGELFRRKKTDDAADGAKTPAE